MISGHGHSHRLSHHSRVLWRTLSPNRGALPIQSRLNSVAHRGQICFLCTLYTFQSNAWLIPLTHSPDLVNRGASQLVPSPFVQYDRLVVVQSMLSADGEGSPPDFDARETHANLLTFSYPDSGPVTAGH